MRVFVDTSAFLSVLDSDDRNHPRARDAWAEMVSSEALLVTNNYVLVETFALLQHRMGIEAVRAFHDDVLPVVNTDWVNESVHRSGVSALLAASKRRLSLVDVVSFESMRRLGIKTAFAFDKHFLEHGFDCVP